MNTFIFTRLDTDEQLSFYYKDENNKLTEIVNEGVFAIGQDSSYFILKKHPVEGFVIDTTETEYYIIPTKLYTKGC